MNTLEALLSERDWLLADGAMGTNLFDLGLAGGACGELWNLTAPEKVASVHHEMIAAGADIVLTNTFGANRYRLALHGLDRRVAAINRAGAELARRAAAGAGRRIVVAGSIGPTGDVLEPLGERTRAEAASAFTEQAQGLLDGGADIGWIETMYAEAELEAAMGAAESVGLPFIATMTFDTSGRTMMGIRPQEMPGLEPCRTHHPVGIGANCGVGPAQLLDSILGIAATAGANALVIAKSNCGLPELGDDFRVRYNGTPAIMADYACMARDAGARIIGGCCGTTARHLRAMRDALGSRPRGSVPSHADIEARLGSLKVTTTTEEAVARAKEDGPPLVSRRHRRRRRDA